MGEMEMLTERDALAVADALEAEYLAVANGEKKPGKMDLEALVRAVQTIRALESRASNAGGAVAKIVGVDEYGPQIEWTKHWVELNGASLYTHPAPASKEPVADERDMVRGVPKSIINAITAYGDARADSKDTGEAIGNAVSAIRAALATAQPLWRSGGKDTERLDWLAQHGAWIAWGRDGEMCRVFHHSDDEDGRAVPFCGWGSGKCYPTAREAIDAAMLAAAPAKPEGV